MFTESGTSETSDLPHRLIDPDEEAIALGRRRLLQVGREMLSAAGSIDKALTPLRSKLLRDQDLLRSAVRIVLEMIAEEDGEAPQCEGGLSAQKTSGRLSSSPSGARAAQAEGGERDQKSSVESDQAALVSPAAATTPERAAAGDQVPLVQDQVPPVSGGIETRSGAGGAARTAPVQSDHAGHSRSAKSTKKKKSTAKRTHRTPQAIAQWAVDFKSRQFGAVQINGMSWWEAKPPEALAAAERQHVSSRFLNHIARACADPRRPIGLQVTENDVEAAEQFAFQEAA